MTLVPIRLMVIHLKIDIQGAELLIFKSGLEKLKKAVVIQTEISFMTLYKDQPAWDEIEFELSALFCCC